MSLRKLGLYCGVVGPILWLTLIATAGALRPGFSHYTEYISELGALGSPTEALMNYGAFGFTGFLYLCFAVAVFATFQNGWLRRAATMMIVLDGIGRMGAGIFPCDPGCVQVSQDQIIHRWFATVGFSAGIASALLWGLAVRGVPSLRPLAFFSVGSGAVALVSLLVMTESTNPALPKGVFEHVATAVLSVWLLVFASRLVRVENRAEA